MEKKIEFSEVVWDTIPVRDGVEGWSMSSNGGNYAFGHRDVYLNGKKVGELAETSSGIPYCQISKGFEQDAQVFEIEGTNLRFTASPKYIGMEDDTMGVITVDDFLAAI